MKTSFRIYLLWLIPLLFIGCKVEEVEPAKWVFNETTFEVDSITVLTFSGNMSNLEIIYSGCGGSENHFLRPGWIPPACELTKIILKMNGEAILVRNAGNETTNWTQSVENENNLIEINLNLDFVTFPYRKLFSSEKNGQQVWSTNIPQTYDPWNYFTGQSSSSYNPQSSFLVYVTEIN